MSVIEFAEKRLQEEIRENDLGADNGHLLAYWRAYLDGARAQKHLSEQEGGRSMTDYTELVKALQAEVNSRTIYGYSVEKLIMFAEMCKRNDVQEHDLKQAAWNLELAVRAVMNERQEIIKNAVGEITMRCTPDFEKAFKEMRDGAKMEVQE